jgi:hypothetical protein
MFIKYLFLNHEKTDQKNKHWVSGFKLIYFGLVTERNIFLKVVFLTTLSSWNETEDGFVEDFQNYAPAAW